MTKRCTSSVAGARPRPPHATPQWKGSNAFKSEHPPVPCRTRLFLLAGSAARFPIFSFWQVVSFVLIPASPLRHAVHRRSSRPAPVSPKSNRELSLPRSSMSGKLESVADWGSSALFAFCEVGSGAHRPAKGSPRVPPNSATRGCCQATDTTERQPWFPEECCRLASRVTRAGMSSRRSRSAGSRMGKTFRR